MKAKAAKKATVPARRPPRKMEPDDADDRFQAEQARVAIADPENQERVPWSKVKRELDL